MRTEDVLKLYMAGVQSMVEARMQPMNKALVRLHLIDGVPLDTIRMENHAEATDVWRDVLVVNGKPTYQVRSRWEGDRFLVCGQWLDGRDIKVTAHAAP